MVHAVRLLIFGLARGTRPDELQPLLGTTAQRDLHVVGLPDATEGAFAVLHMAPDRDRARRLARRINSACFQGRHLQCWVTALPWS